MQYWVTHRGCVAQSIRCLKHTSDLVLHMSSVLHEYALESVTFCRLMRSWNRFSKPVERSTPSQRYPGAIWKRFGGGRGPW